MRSRWQIGLLMAVVLLACARKAPAQHGPHNSVKLVWTAVGDDSLSGRAAEYDLRFATTAITPSNFHLAARFAVAAPSPPGQADSVLVTGLAPATRYWFAIKTADEVPNWSAISNVFTTETAAPPDVIRPAAIINLGRR